MHRSVLAAVNTVHDAVLLGTTQGVQRGVFQKPHTTLTTTEHPLQSLAITRRPGNPSSADKQIAQPATLNNDITPASTS